MDKKVEFEKLSMPYIDMLYGTALRMIRNPSDAEDLVQETYLKAFRSFHQFEESTNFKAWIFKILTNSYINRYKKNKKTPEQISVEDTPDFYLYDKVMETEDLGGESPEKEFLSRFIPDNIKQAVHDLSDDYRMTFVLSDIYGFSYEEIAETMEVSLGTVKSRLFRARRMLQRGLWEYAVDQGIISKNAAREK